LEGGALVLTSGARCLALPLDDVTRNMKMTQ